ncbi:MAG: prkC 4 [Planctomycetota bacterium]|nr:prkC 4 [Planctomycetota bacterium]
MNSLVPARVHSSGSLAAPASADRAVLELERAWSLGTAPSVEAIWTRFSPEGSVDLLAALIKADLRRRFELGDRPDVAAYLERFAPLRAARERVVSLVYEEYCLREERGEQLDPDVFCARYDPWRDSLLSQLRYHRMLSQAVGVTPSTSRLPNVGERFQSFRLGSVLGQGGTARVFLARDESLGDREVALKVSTDRGKEPAIQGRLDHAHIVPVLSVTDDAETGLRGLCMPYRPGLTLDKVIREVDPASRPRSAMVLRETAARAKPAGTNDDRDGASWKGFPAKGTYAEGVAWIVSVVARALAYAHGQNVHHRDIKPANVLLTDRDGPQLLDFNLAHSPQTPDQAEAALRGGTLPYMAPEQLEAFLDPERWSHVGESADIYALGLLLGELLTGSRPEAPDAAIPLPRAIGELLDRRAIGLGSVRDLNPEIPHGLDAIISRCLAFRPEYRYSSARALAEDLERFYTRRPLVEVKNPSRIERTRNFTTRFRVGRLALASIGTVAAVLVVAAAFATMYAPKKAAAYYLDIAKSLVTSGKYVAARQAIATARKLEPDSFNVRSSIAQIYGNMGDGAAALKEAGKAIGLAEKQESSRVSKSQLAMLYHQRGGAARMAGDLATATAAYRKALEYASYLFSAHAGLAEIAVIQGDYAEAEKSFTSAIDAVKRAKEMNLSSDVDDAKLSMYWRKRGEVRVTLGHAVPRPPAIDGVPQPRKSAEYERAMAYFQDAKRDVEAARKLIPKPLNKDAYSLERAAASVEMALGDLASEKDDYYRSVPHFDAARVLLDRALTRSIESRATMVLSKAVDHRLAEDRPKLERLRSASKPPTPPRPPG